jgi:hypothetical protein
MGYYLKHNTIVKRKLFTPWMIIKTFGGCWKWKLKLMEKAYEADLRDCYIPVSVAMLKSK